MIKECLVTRIKAHFKDGYQSEKNYHIHQGGISAYHGCNKNYSQEKDHREDFYPCQKVVCASRS